MTAKTFKGFGKPPGLRCYDMKIPVDSFSTVRSCAKGFISYRVDDPDKMRDYDTIRGYFSKNSLNYILSKVRHSAIILSRTYGKERGALKALLKKKLGKLNTLPGAIVLWIFMGGLGFIIWLFRIVSLYVSFEKIEPRKSIISDRSDYIKFDAKEYLDINFKDIWRPSIVCLPGETIRARIKNLDKSEIRLGFALLENTDPKVFSGDYSVVIKYSMESGSDKREGKFQVPVNHENDDMEHNRHSLWLDFKIIPDGSLGKDVEFTLTAEYWSELAGEGAFVKTPSIAWGSPRVVKNKLPASTKKILVLSLETFTDPRFISENYGIPTGSIFKFLNDGKWKIFTRSYAQSDGTLGAAGSFFTGLTPLQHDLFDYGSPFYTKHSKAWDINISTLAQLVKERGFSTYSAGLKAFSGYAGCSRGFDSHFSCYTLHELDCADFDWLYQVWNSASENDAFIFMHFDRLHKPYAKWNRRINKVYSADELTDKLTPIEKYTRQMRELDIQLQRIIDFLKSIDQHDNTLIICTGDHGGAYAWEKRLAYDLYEDRIRVPLWVKEADWSVSSSDTDTEQPVNATIFPFQAVLKRLGADLPGYYQKLAQARSEFKGVAISETATAPSEQDYILSLTDNAHKYVVFMKVDWARNRILSKEKEFLQPYEYVATDKKLTRDISSAEPEKFKKMRELAERHIDSSFEFRRNYPRA